MEETTVKTLWDSIGGIERVNLCKLAGYTGESNPRFIATPPHDVISLFNGDSIYAVDFESKDSAREWMESQINDNCNNHRFTFLNPETMEELEEEEDYNKRADSGCCATFDGIIRVNGRVARIGCNYGH